MFSKLFILGVILAVTYGFSEDVEDSTEKIKNTKGCKIAKCDVCNVNKKICLSCSVGWGRNNVGTCSACGANCNLCSLDVNVCTECSTPTLYKLIGGKCQIATTIDTTTQAATTIDTTTKGATTIDTTTQAATTIDPCATSFLTTTQEKEVVISKLDLTKSPAFQINDFAGKIASLALDGNVYSYSHTGVNIPNEAAWWVVDLGNVTRVFKVAIYARDCCPDRLANIVVGVTNKFIPSEGVRLGEYTICNQCIGTPAAGSRSEVACAPSTPPGQFLIIQQPANGPGYLTLCEVEVFVNLLDL